YLLATDTDTKVVLEVLDATGEVLWTKDGETTAGYHEVPWRSERRRGPPGAGGAGGPGRGRGNDGPRPGRFAVRLRFGEQQQTLAFSVHDRRGASSLLGAAPSEAREVSDEDEEGGEQGEADEGERDR
ncbi:MAG: hypothetical protein H6835_20950, partial [Planctomycetes bacterium]|nr:hypothetical protein [Planctomycetota bacterium]